MRIRSTLLLLILLAALSALGGRPLETVRPGEIAYLVVVRNGAGEPDVAALGGRLLQSWADHRLVAIPADRAEAMAALPNVEYVQRIASGDSAPAAPANHTLRASASAVQPVAPPPWDSGTYLYDPSGNIKSIGGDRAVGQQRKFTYDGVGRLTNAIVMNQTQSYAYDPYGNLARIDAVNLNVSPANNQFPLFDYDAAGSVTSDAGGRTYYYDALGMVTAIHVASTDTTNGDLRYVYTADDERILLGEGPVTRYRVRDYGARVLREWKQSGGILEWERDYIYAGGALVAGEVQLDQLQNGLRHYHTDHLGSIRMVTDGAGQLVSIHDYMPFGAEFTSMTTEWDNTNKGPRDPRKFTGHERDYFFAANVPDGEYIDYMHARYYAARWGRFLSVDPGMDLEKAQKEPQRWNRYAYVLNNPIRLVDPNGRADRDSVITMSLNVIYTEADYSNGVKLYGVLPPTVRQTTERAIVEARGDYAEMGIALVVNRFEAGSLVGQTGQIVNGPVHTPDGDVAFSDFAKANHGKGLTVIASGRFAQSNGGSSGLLGNIILGANSDKGVLSHEIGHSLGNVTTSKNPATYLFTELKWSFQKAIRFTSGFQQTMRANAEKISCEPTNGGCKAN